MLRDDNAYHYITACLGVDEREIQSSLKELYLNNELSRIEEQNDRREIIRYGKENCHLCRDD